MEIHYDTEDRGPMVDATGRVRSRAELELYKRQLERSGEAARLQGGVTREGTVQAISLLGATTPERDLGPIRMAMDKPPEFQSGGTQQPRTQVSDLAAQVAEVIKATDVWQFLSQMAKDAKIAEQGLEQVLPPAPPPVQVNAPQGPVARMAKPRRQGRSKQDIDRVVAYACSRGIGFNEALREMESV